MAILVLAESLLICTVANAENDAIISCDEAPPAATVEAPKLFEGLASVTCTKYGHFIGAADGYLWTFAGGLYPVILQAQLGSEDLKETNHEAHFLRIEGRSLDGKEAEEAFDSVFDEFDMPEEAQDVAYELSATNQDGIVQKLYFTRVAEDSVWGFACAPECQPELPFMVLYFGQENSSPE